MPRRRLGGALAVAAILVIGILLAFALALRNVQTTAREDVEQRFGERAKISAALTSSLFASSAQSTTEDNRRVVGASPVPQAGLERIVKTGQYAYAEVLDAQGRVIASTADTPASLAGAVAAKAPHVRGVLSGAPFGLSGLVDLPGGGSKAIEYAVPYRFGTRLRVLVTGFRPELISNFLGGYLDSLPNNDSADAYVVDATGGVVGTTDDEQAAATKLAVPGVLDALNRTSEGAFGSEGEDRYLTSANVTGTQWRVVLTASTKDLYRSVSGARQVVPWIVFAAFALAALMALILLRGLLRGNTALARANEDLASKNDDVERANDELETRARELARSNADLQEFASIASHDLQEPLRKVQFFGDQIVDRHGDELPEEVIDHLDRMRRAAGRMRSLTDDLLTFSRVSTSGSPFKPVDLREIADEVISDLEQAIAASDGTVGLSDLPDDRG